jgi:hypothetical protein
MMAVHSTRAGACVGYCHAVFMLSHSYVLDMLSHCVVTCIMRSHHAQQCGGVGTKPSIHVVTALDDASTARFR